MSNPTQTTTIALKAAWTVFKNENPKVRIRDAAKQLGVTEAELVYTGIGETTTLLDNNFSSLLEQIHTLGKVMALTRNENVVHERKGVYLNSSFNTHIGLFVGEDIDLRLFMGKWAHGFAVSEGERHSFQFFGKDGEAIHKIFLTEASNKDAYSQLVEQFKAINQEVELIIEPAERTTEKWQGISDEDTAAFQTEWKNLQDTHDFFKLLQKYKLPRLEALQLAPEGFAFKVDNTSTRRVLQTVATQEIPIMIFVGNSGCIQIHTGTINKLFEMGPWYNIMDPDFNLHLREDAIATTWVVIKPTVDGIVTSLELFDDKGEIITQIFGKRKPGIPEMPEWQEVIRKQTTEA